MGKQSSTWKSIERQIAAYIGGQRVPVTGRHDQTTPDIAHLTYAIEVKHRRDIPLWLGALISAHNGHLVAAFKDSRPISMFLLRDLGAIGGVVHTRLAKVVLDRRLPILIKNALKQAECAGTALKKRPLVILHPHRKPIESSICMLILPTITAKRLLIADNRE